MATILVCDICRKKCQPHEIRQSISLGDVYEGNISVASYFKGDVCTDCDRKIEKASNDAICREISKIRKEADADQR